MQRRKEDLYDFVSIGELADTAKQFIHLGLANQIRRQGRRSGLERVEQYVLQRTRDYLSRVREGFVLSVRTADITNQDEIGYLVERVLIDWDSLSKELGLEDAPTAQSVTAQTNAVAQRLEEVRDQLLAFGMAAIAMGMLPRLPQEMVTFPQGNHRLPTYADITAPASPAAMLQRIEEIERMLWRMAAHDLIDLAERYRNSLRRTYGFFETSAWLVRQESKRFGVKMGGTLTF